jgi:hypothetical protein
LGVFTPKSNFHQTQLKILVQAAQQSSLLRLITGGAVVMLFAGPAARFEGGEGKLSAKVGWQYAGTVVGGALAKSVQVDAFGNLVSSHPEDYGNCVPKWIEWRSMSTQSLSLWLMGRKRRGDLGRQLTHPETQLVLALRRVYRFLCILVQTIRNIEGLLGQ